MRTNSSWHDPVLINTVGHAAGLLVFGLIIILLVRDWRAQGVRQTRLSLFAAVLAFGWNLGSLIALGSRGHDSPTVAFVMMASFANLSLLPAILLQVVLQGRHKRLAVAGYAVSVASVALHFSEFGTSSTSLHQTALVTIAVGFGLLALAAILLERQPSQVETSERSEWIRLGSLLLFAVSFLHFGYKHLNSPWSAEIAWHHIGIPAVLVILLRDYRFFLLDTFVRFVINFGLAAVYVFAVLLSLREFRLWDAVRADSFLAGIALLALCLSLVLFAYLRNMLQSWVTRSVFLRSDLQSSLDRIGAIAVSVKSEGELLARSAEEVSLYLHTEHFVIADKPLESTAQAGEPSILFLERAPAGSPAMDFRPEAQIPLWFSSGDSLFLVAGRRRGGRRYLSEDLDAMRQLGSAIVGQVERFRAEELKRLVSQAELRALQAQINPHFLFNSLNTLYGTIDRRSSEARRLVLNLAELFRYLLKSDRIMVQLSEELRIVSAYLEIESLRLGDRLETQLLASDAARSATIPAFTIQPLVENAVKHGVASKSAGGKVCVSADETPEGVRVTVQDTGSGFKERRQKEAQGAGVGLQNVRHRLLLCYGPAANLEVQSSSAGTIVTFLIPADPRSAPFPMETAMSKPLIS